MIRGNLVAERIAVEHCRELVRGSLSPKLTRVSLSAYGDANREVEELRIEVRFAAELIDALGYRHHMRLFFTRSAFYAPPATS